MIPTLQLVTKYLTKSKKIFLRIWSHLLKKSLVENFIFCEMREATLVYLNTETGSVPW